MPDSRLVSYARLLVERSVNVQPGWQVLIQSTPLARPLLEEVVRHVAQRGAYALPRLSYASMGAAWANEAPEALLGEMAPIERYVHEQVDAYIFIAAPENTRDGSEVSPERQVLLAQAGRAAAQRRLSLQVPWVGCQFPTQALAQEAGMTLGAYEDFLYGACLLDWDEEGRKMAEIKARFDRADQVRIVGDDTDLTFSLKGRPGQIDDGHYNMPGGEVFYCPVEESVEGVISYREFPAVYGGHQVEGVRLQFQGGRVVEASAARGEEYLQTMLNADEGARFLGEFGIGCNPGIQRHMKNTLFDEKIYGTIHLAIGSGFPFVGGRNVSKVHWDMVKDLRQGGKIYCDGELVQENGKWVW